MPFPTRFAASLLLLLSFAVSAGAGITAGPEVHFEAPFGPWAGDPDYRPATATDGERTLVVFAAGPGSTLYAQLLDRDGQPLLQHPRRIAEPDDFRNVRTVWSGGRWVVFYNGVALVLSRDGRALGLPRPVDSYVDTQAVVAREDEIVLVSRTAVTRLRSDTTLIQEIALPPTTSRRAVAAGPRGIAIFTADRGGITLQRLDRSTLSPPVEVTPRRVLGEFPNGGELVWTGSEYVGVWSDCGYPRSCTAWMTRFDERGRALGEPREVGELDVTVRNGLTLTSLGDNTVFVTMESGSTIARGVGRRFRAGQEVQSTSIFPHPPLAASVNAHGVLHVVNAEMLVSVLPVHAPFPVLPEQRTMLFSPADERAWTTASTDTHAAVLRRRAVGGQPLKFVASVMTHDLAPVHELEVAAENASMVSDGRDFWLLWTAPESVYAARLWLQKIAPGTTPVEIGDRPAFYWWIRFARFKDSFLILWHDGRSKVWLREWNADGLQPPVLMNEQPADGWRPQVVPAGDDLLYLWQEGRRWRSRKITSAGQTAGAEDVLPYAADAPSCAWNGFAVGCSFETSDGYYFTLRDAAGVFRETARIDDPEIAWSASVKAVGERYAMLRIVGLDTRLFLFGRDGKLLERLDLENAGYPASLLPLAGARAWLFYTRFLYTPPAFNVRSMFARELTLD